MLNVVNATVLAWLNVMIVTGRAAFGAGRASAKGVKNVLGAGEMAMILTENYAIAAVVMVMLIVLVAMGEDLIFVHLVLVKEKLNVKSAMYMEESEFIVGITMGRVEEWNKRTIKTSLNDTNNGISHRC